MKTKKGVFIVESLDFEDEDNHLFEGEVLSRILSFSNIPTVYYYVRTKRELEEIINIFGKSKYRYLHISCHGSKSSISTSLDEIDFNELGIILNPHLDKKRLFLSTCLSTNKDLAEQILLQSECYSIIGPANSININDAVIFWSSFYHLMFKYESMKRVTLVNTIDEITSLFTVKINYFSRSESKGIKVKKYPQSTKTKDK